jgi:hypothetical protein
MITKAQLSKEKEKKRKIGHGSQMAACQQETLAV